MCGSTTKAGNGAKSAAIRDGENTLHAALVTGISLDTLNNANAIHRSEQWCQAGGWQLCQTCQRNYQVVTVGESGYCLACAATVIEGAQRDIAALQQQVDDYSAIIAGPDDYWADDPDYPVQQWAHEVANGDTRRGYHEWVRAEREADEHEAERMG